MFFFAFFSANHFTYRAGSKGSKWAQLMDLKLDENQMETDSYVLAKISFILSQIIKIVQCFPLCISSLQNVLL
jgi:hypothetical protein